MSHRIWHIVLLSDGHSDLPSSRSSLLFLALPFLVLLIDDFGNVIQKTLQSDSLPDKCGSCRTSVGVALIWKSGCKIQPLFTRVSVWDRPVKCEWREQQFGALLGCIRISHFCFFIFKPFFEHWTERVGKLAMPTSRTERQFCCSRQSDLIGLVWGFLFLVNFQTMAIWTSMHEP